MAQFLYILTNNNRNDFQIGITQDLDHTLHCYKEQYQAYYDRYKKASRLVYVEKLDSQEEALKKLAAMTTFTKPQKERLIRNINPNWADLSQSSLIAERESRFGQLAS